MKRKHFLANAVLWAAAILAAAIVGAPALLSTVLLPVMGAFALLVTWPKSQAKPKLPISHDHPLQDEAM